MSYRQTTGKVRASGVTSMAISFASLPLTGSMIVVPFAAEVASGGATGNVDDNQSHGNYTKDINKNSTLGGTYGKNAVIARLTSVSTSSGTFTVTVRPDASQTSYFAGCAVEVIGANATPLDKTVDNTATDDQPDTGTTSALAQTNELAFAAVHFPYAGDPSLDDPPADWCSLWTETDGSTYAGSQGSYRFPSSTSGLIADWGTAVVNTNRWVAGLATYKLDNAINLHLVLDTIVQAGSPIGMGTTRYVTAGRQLFIAARIQSGRAITAVSVGGESATQIGSDLSDTTVGSLMSWWTVTPTTSGTKSVTFTYTGSTSNVGALVIEAWGSNGLALTVGNTVSEMTTGDSTLTTGAANAAILAQSMTNVGDPTCDNLGGGKILLWAAGNHNLYDGAGGTCDAGAAGSKTISFSSNTSIFAIELRSAGYAPLPGALAWIRA